MKRIHAPTEESLKHDSGSPSSNPPAPLVRRPVALGISSLLLLTWLCFLGYVAWQIHFRAG